MMQRGRETGQSLSGASALHTGRVLGNRYELLMQIGTGGMGEVWKARTIELEPREVVLKFLPSGLRGDYAAGAAFRAEYRNIWQLRHQHIPGLLELGEDPEVGYFQVMYWLEGLDLRKVLHGSGSPGLSVANVLWIVQRVAAAVDFAHERGIVHGDIKPENIMVDADQERLDLIDFGLTVASVWKSSVAATGAGQVLGTRGYLSPERERGDRVKPACDRWSLAVLAWELLTGGLPPAAVQVRQRSDQKLVVSELPARLAVLVPIFNSAFAAEPDDRFESCVQFVAALQQAVPVEPDIAGLKQSGRLPHAGVLQGEGAEPRSLLSSGVTRLVPVRRSNRNTVTATGLAVLLVAILIFFRVQVNAPGIIRNREYSRTIGMDFCLISPGESLCGSSDELTAVWAIEQREMPQISTMIAGPFYMSRTEVTQKMWFSVMGTRPWRELKGAGLRILEENDDFPAVGFTWEEAAEFCSKLSEQEGRVYRMPTEFEWEYACRAGTTSPFSFALSLKMTDLNLATGDEFSWSAIAPEHKKYVLCLDDSDPDQSQLRQPDLRAGARLPNGWGLHDMHGSVWEMCLNEYDEGAYKTYSSQQTVALQNPANIKPPSFKGAQRVIRGGSFGNTLEYCRSAVRDRVPAAERYAAEKLPARRDDTGLRLVFVPGAPEDAAAFEENGESFAGNSRTGS